MILPGLLCYGKYWHKKIGYNRLILGNTMPGYKAHLVGGVTAYGFGLYLLQSLQPSPLTMVEWAGFALLGSLFPDIDTKSKGQKIFYKVLLAVFCGLLLTNRIPMLVILGFLALIPLLVNHRGLLHRAWFVIVVPVVVALLCSVYTQVSCRALLFDALFFSLGALSHLWLDLGVRKMFRI
jgi:hypothetical protein